MPFISNNLQLIVIVTYFRAADDLNVKIFENSPVAVNYSCKTVSTKFIINSLPALPPSDLSVQNLDYQKAFSG